MKLVSIILACAFFIAGCASNRFSDWMHEGSSSSNEPAPSHYQPRQVRESPSPRERWAPQKNSGENAGEQEKPQNHGSETATREPPASSDGALRPDRAARVPVVTLGGGRDDSADGATALVNRTWEKLSRINRSRLGSDDAALYDQANSFLVAARQALNEKDYPAAAGFARKASTLTVKLAPSTRPVSR